MFVNDVRGEGNCLHAAEEKAFLKHTHSFLPAANNPV